MAAPANTEVTLTQVGLREDLTDQVSLVAPQKTPVFTLAKKVNVENTYHEWETEDLDEIDLTNSNPEGFDVGTIDAPNRRTRLGNYAQLLDKTGSVSATARAVNVAGVDDELTKQKFHKGIAIRRDFEAIMLAKQASQPEVTGGSAQDRKTASIQSFLTTSTAAVGILLPSLRARAVSS